MNKKVFLGIGNVYSDEICFKARVNPTRGIKTIRQAEKKRLFKSIKKILKRSMEYDGLSFYLPVSNKKLRFDRFLQVYNREGENCQYCRSGVIKKDKLSSRNYFYCPLCQN